MHHVNAAPRTISLAIAACAGTGAFEAGLRSVPRACQRGMGARAPCQCQEDPAQAAACNRLGP